jgi:hypothetical protein
MHEGVMAAAVEWAALHESLQRHCGVIRREHGVSPAEWLQLPDGKDAFHVAAREGRAYLLDPSMVLTTGWDLVVTLASELNCTVLSAGAETVSGTYWFAAAEPDGMRRFHWNLRASLTQPFDLGTPLLSESRLAFDDVDGNGLFAGMAELGFDPGVVTRPIEGGERYAWTEFKLPPNGPIAQQVKTHHELYARRDKDDWTKHIKAVPRSGGGIDLQYQPPPERKSLFDKFRRRHS